jgi:FtsH-binding integral membrane protein
MSNFNASYDSYDNGYAGSSGYSVASVKAEFLRRTYMHLAGAILAFTIVEAGLINALQMAGMQGAVFTVMTKMGWIGVLLAFMVASWVARTWAHSSTSLTMQYMGLGLYVLAEAIIFLPLLIYASHFAPNIIVQAGIMTLAVFAGLTTAVLMTGKDFSFLGTAISLGSWLILATIVCSMLFGFQLGLWFSLGMVAFACACILYTTSTILHHYHPSQYVGAALELFSSIAYLFYNIMMVLLRSRE